MMVEFCILEKLFEFEGMDLEFIREVVVHECVGLYYFVWVLVFCLVSESVIKEKGFEFVYPVGDGFL